MPALSPINAPSSPAAKRATLAVVGLAFFTDTLVYAMLPPLLPEYARLHGLNQTRLGLLFASYAVALLLATLPLGAWVDRRGRRGPFLAGLVGLGATTILFAYARSFPMLLLARVLQGVAATANWVAGLALLSAQFPSGQRGRAMSAVFACTNLGLLLGPAFSGWMLQHWSAHAAFLAAAGLAVLDALARLALLPPDQPAPPVRTRYLALLRDGAVRVLAGTMVLGAILGSLLEAVLPLHLSRRLGMDGESIGLVFATAALASTFISPAAGLWTDRRGAARPIRLGLALAALLLAVAAFVPSRPAMFVFMFLVGGTCSLLMSPCGPALAGRVEGMAEAGQGSAFALLNMSFSLGIMVGPMVGSALVDLVGLPAALAGFALVCACYLLPAGLLSAAAAGSAGSAS